MTVDAGLFEVLASGDLRIVAEAIGAPPGHGAAGLVVRPAVAEVLRTPTDLRDLRIAVPERGSYLEALLASLLKQGWLWRGDVEIQVVPPAAVAERLASGGLDGAMAEEPLLSELEERGRGVVWRRSDTIAANHASAVLVFSTRFIRTEPEAARGAMTAYLRAARDYNAAFLRYSSTGRDDLMAIISRETGVDLARYERMVLPGVHPNGMINFQTLLADERYFRAAGHLEREVNLPTVVETQLATHAITQLGEFR